MNFLKTIFRKQEVAVEEKQAAPVDNKLPEIKSVDQNEIDRQVINDIMTSMGLKPVVKTDLDEKTVVVPAVQANCVNSETLVVTNNGTVPVADIAASDSVLTANGSFEKVVTVETKPEIVPDIHDPSTWKELITFDKVTKSFGDKLVLSDVSFTIKDIPGKGEIVSIVGQSGCGKSTLIRLLAGLRPHFPPTSGTIVFNGKTINGPGSDRGVIDQKYSLLPNRTVLDNIAFGLELRGMKKKERIELAHNWLKKIKLEGNENRYPHELSGGMQQRVAIAATLILRPNVILMDEPFGALDPKTRISMQQLLVDLWNEEESTIFIITHQIEEAVYLGDRVFRMGVKPGRLVEILEVPRPDCSPEEMRKMPWFQETVQELLRRMENEAPPSGELPCPKRVF